MRSLHLVTGISAFSALIVAIGVGCSSSSNKGSTTVSDSGTPVEDGGEEAAAMVCPDDGGSINSLAVPATGDAGANALECEKSACASTFSACAADACCNNTFYDAFTCLAAAAGDGGSTTSGGISTAGLACFTTAEASSDTNVTSLLSCLVGAESTCGIGDGGSTKPASDAASEAAATESDAASDAAATATDASGDGAVEQ
jgi:hypothetical protein